MSEDFSGGIPRNFVDDSDPDSDAVDQLQVVRHERRNAGDQLMKKIIK
jgi:hypothetical protein